MAYPDADELDLVRALEPEEVDLVPPPEPEHANAPGPDVQIPLSCLAIAAIIVLVAGFALGVSTLRIVGVVSVLLLGVGTAPLQLSSRPSLATRLGVAGVVGFATITCLGTVMALVPLWHPAITAVAVCVPAAVAHWLGTRSALVASAGKRGAGAADLWARARESVVRSHALLRPAVVLTFVGTTLWLGAALSVGHVEPGLAGLLTHISPAWFAGIVLVLAGVATARGEREAYAAAAVLSLMLATTLTPALVYGMPRSQSAAKHVELAALLMHAHHLNPGAGIYQAYSGFFSAIAWLCSLARVSDPIGLATFWPVIIAFVRIAVLRFFFGRVIESRYRAWCAVAVVALVDAIGGDYFSPQSVGYVIGIGVFALVLTGRPTRISERARIALLVLCGCSLAITHELSPYIVGGVLIVLAVLRQAEPRWAAAAILAPAGLWALINRHVLSGFLSFSALGNISNFAPPKTVSNAGLHRLAIVGDSSHALLAGLLVLIGAAAVALARNRGRRWAWSYGASAGVGLVFVAVNPYGNEGIFRSALFAIPWLALLAARGLPQLRSRFGPVAFLAVSVVLLATFMLGEFGMDASAVIRRADLTSLRILERTAPANSYLVSVGYGDLPSTVPDAGAGSTELAWDAFTDQSSLRSGGPGPADLSLLTTRLERYAHDTSGAPAANVYAIWSPATLWYGEEYGLETSQQSFAWLRLLLHSPQWHTVYASAGTYLFRVSGGQP